MRAPLSGHWMAAGRADNAGTARILISHAAIGTGADAGPSSVIDGEDRG